MSILTKVTSSIDDLAEILQKEGLGSCFERDRSLAPYTSFRVGGRAKIFLAPENEEEMIRAYQVCINQNIEPRILGGGYNLLILTEEIPVVISTRKLKGLEFDGNQVKVLSGTSLPLLVKKSVNHGLAGIETLVGIPGSVGGSLAGNAGSKPENIPTEIGDFINKVRVITKFGQVLELKKEDITFEYRNSSLRPYLILGATLEARFSDVSILTERWKRFFQKKLASQPFNAKSAGCIFKNPPQGAAWRLISDAALTGQKVGGAAISEKHCNFIVNRKGARAQDIWELINLIREKVFQASGVALAVEVKIW